MSISLGIEGPHRLPLSFNLLYNPLYQRVAKDRTVIKDLKETAAAKILMEGKKKQEKRHSSSKESMAHVCYSGFHFYCRMLSCYCV